MSLRVLCIGGHFDGEMKEVMNGNAMAVRFAVPVPMPVRPRTTGRLIAENMITSETYIRIRLIESDLLVHESVRPEDAVEKLIEGYRTKGE